MNDFGNYTVIKKNKRLYIQDDKTGELIYSPPDVLRQYIASKDDFLYLCMDLTRGIPYIQAVMAFENLLYARKTKRKRNDNVHTRQPKHYRV